MAPPDGQICPMHSSEFLNGAFVGSETVEYEFTCHHTDHPSGPSLLISFRRATIGAGWRHSWSWARPRASERSGGGDRSLQHRLEGVRDHRVGIRAGSPGRLGCTTQALRAYPLRRHSGERTALKYTASKYLEKASAISAPEASLSTQRLQVRAAGTATTRSLSIRCHQAPIGTTARHGKHPAAARWPTKCPAAAALNSTATS